MPSSYPYPVFPCLLLLTALIGTVCQGHPPTNPNKKSFTLQPQQSLDLSVATAVRIALLTNATQSLDKAHLLQYTQHQGIIVDHDYQQWNITFHYQVYQGSAQFYVGPCSGFAGPANLKSPELQFSVDTSDGYVRQYLHVFEGTTTLSSLNLRSYFLQEVQGQKIINKQFCLLVLPSKLTKFIIKLGLPEYIIKPIKMQQPSILKSTRSDIDKKIYLLKTESQYNVRIQRKHGFPSISIIQCPKNKECYQQRSVVPRPKSQTAKGASVENYVQHNIESMLSKMEQLTGKVCVGCELYLVLESKQSDQAQIQLMLEPPNYIPQLKQNQILHEQIGAKNTKKYGFKVNSKQKVKLNIQIYQGQISIIIQQSKGQWKYQPKQSTGVISIEIPAADQLLSYNVSITATKSKDSTYSLVYSSGEYEIFIRDGYPTSHVLMAKQNISFLYANQEVRNDPIYLTFRVNNSLAMSHLKLRVFYYQDDKLKQKQKLEYIYKKQQPKSQIPYTPPSTPSPTSPSPTPSPSYYPLTDLTTPITSQQTSSIIRIPGQYPKLQLQFIHTFNQSIQLSITINDEQIIFLPINNSLPLQMDKNSSINLLIDNNQEGTIQLIIKKCDQSSPLIAYALNAKNFMIGNFDYQSLGDSQRVFRNSIRVKKGGGLYVRVMGDGISDSFLEITAKYLQLKNQTQGTTGTIKKGNHGQINYQLITNSKVQIWFKQVECSAQIEQQCHKWIQYRYFWSTNRANLFRQMICPALFLYNQDKNSKNGHQLVTQGYLIQNKPGADGIISLKHTLNDSIIYIGLKAINQKNGEQFIYKDIEIVTISGQLQRMSTSYLFISIGSSIAITALIIALIRRQARLGYTPVNTSERQKRKKSKLDLVRSN